MLFKNFATACLFLHGAAAFAPTQKVALLELQAKDSHIVQPQAVTRDELLELIMMDQASIGISDQGEAFIELRRRRSAEAVAWVNQAKADNENAIETLEAQIQVKQGQLDAHQAIVDQNAAAQTVHDEGMSAAMAAWNTAKANACSDCSEYTRTHDRGYGDVEVSWTCEE